MLGQLVPPQGVYDGHCGHGKGCVNYPAAFDSLDRDHLDLSAREHRTPEKVIRMSHVA